MSRSDENGEENGGVQRWKPRCCLPSTMHCSGTSFEPLAKEATEPMNTPLKQNQHRKQNN
eukprot:1565008-Amphidinium_carterae.1